MAISVGSVEVDVIPTTQGVYARLRAGLVPAATRAGEDAGSAAGRSFGPAMQREVGNIGLSIGQQIGRQIAARITAEIRAALRDGITRGGAAARPAATRQGEETGGAFARAMKARLEAAFRSLPKADVRLSDTGVDADLARLRARMETLSGKRIGVDVDVAAAQAEITDIEERLRRLGAAHPNIAVRADTAAARAQLAEMRAEIDRLTANPARIRVETDGSFGQRLRAQVQAAQASLPNINIGADTSPAEVEIARLRAALGTLADQRVGIDIDAATATARIDEIQARLQRLSASDADVAVRVDSAAAVAQLAQVQAMVAALDGEEANVKVDTSGALSAVFQLSVAIGGLAALPAIPVLAAGAGALVSSFVAAGAGVGAFAAAALPALSSIKGALDAQKQAQDAVTNATAKGSQTGAQSAQRALQMAGAQQALASAQRNAARQIADAERGVSDAVRQAAQNNAQAAQQVKSARQSLADAYQQAADRMRQANAQVSQAERDLTQAQKSARQAQLDLTAARKEAVQQLEDLNNQLADSQLSQRDAEIALKEAALQRDAVLKSATATELDKQKALLAYDQAVQRLKEQTTETKRLKTETTAANKAGVEGSDTVKRAQEQVASAQQDVVDKTAALKAAQQNVTKTQIANSRAIADAQAKLGTAQKNVAVVQQQGAEAIARAQERVVQAQQSGADSVASAQRQIESASLSAAGGVDQAATAQAKYQAALAKLTPAARGTFNAFVSLRSAFQAWSRSLQPAIMPIFTRALVGLKNALPGLTPFVLAAARAIGTLQDRVSRGFRSPWWRGFRKDLAGSVEPAIVGLGVSFGRIFKGMAGIVQAFLPHMDSISKRMQTITGRFANWGTSLKGSPVFEHFLDYASTQGPVLARSIGDIASAFYQVSKSLAPLSGPVLQVLGAVARAVASIATTLPWLIQGMYLAYIATRIWTLALIIYNAVVNANPITLIIIAIIALVAAVIYAYKHFTWFRNGVQVVWAWLKDSYNKWIKPFVDAFISGFKYLYNILVGHSIIPDLVNAILWWIKLLFTFWGAIFKGLRIVIIWLWTSVLKPFFIWFGQVVAWLWTSIIKPYIGFLIAYWQTVASVAMWLWHNILAPVFHGIATVITWWYNNIVKRYFALVKFYFQVIAAVAMFLYNKGIKPAFNGIALVISFWWRNVVQRYFGYVRTALRVLGDAFKWLYDHSVKPVWNAISSAISFTWKHGIKPAFDALKSAIHKVGDAFAIAKDAIGKAWHKIEDLTKKPINFVLNTVWNHGIVSIWKKIGGWIPGLPKLKTVPLLAQGGTVPAAPGVFNQPTAIVGEGNPRHPEFVIPTDPKYRARALGLWQAAGGQLMADGGIIGKIKDIGSKIAGGISSAASFLSNPGKALDKLLANLMKPLHSISGSGWGKLVFGLPKTIWKGLKGLVTGGGGDGVLSGFGDLGAHGASAKQSQAIARAMLGRFGWGQDQMSPLIKLWNGESGWRWNALNRSSGAYGIPQALPASKMGSAGADWRTNAATQIKWGLGYIKHRGDYGSPARAWAKWLSRSPHWYDDGGFLQPGLNLAYNGTGRPEPVFTQAQANALTKLNGLDGGGVGDLNVAVYVGDREITDIARTEVRRSNGELLTALGARPRG